MRDERQYVVEAITAFLNGTGGPWDWKRFISTSLRNAELDRIRRCAHAVDLPLNSEGVATLRDLLGQAELLSDDNPMMPKPWRIETGMLAGLLLGALLWWVNHLPGAGLFHDLHLLVAPVAIGAFVVTFRNSRKKVGAYAPKIVAQNRQGRV